MHALLQDLRYGLRLVRKNPGFAAVTAAVLALGIGANTAIFSIVNAVLLKSLPFPGAERIVSVPHTPPQDIFPGQKTFSVSPANYYDWKAQNDVFEHMTIWTEGVVNVVGQGEPESMTAGVVSSEFFSVLGARPLAGRLFAEGDDEAGQPVTVLSEGLWRTRFGANPSAVGGTIVLNGQSYTIVGVLPSRLTYPDDAQLWIPLVFTPEQRAIRGIHDFLVLARLKPGVQLENARAQMNAISARLAAQYPADDKGWGAAVIPFHESMVEDVRTALLVLLGAVGFVLLIACANVANLVLARTLGRRKEIAVRTALGASRGRIVRQLFVETILLSLVGGILGVFAARLVVKVIVAAVGPQMPRVSEIHVDGAVLLFALAISLLTGALAGALPAWRLTRDDPNEALKQGGRADADTGSPAIRNALVVAEVALALMLMIGAGLLVRSLARLRGVDPGFDPGQTLTALVAIPDEKYTTPESVRLFHQQVLEKVRALPGVEAAGGISTLPLTNGGSTQPITIEGRPAGRMSEQPEVAVRIVTPGTMKALRVRLVAGRDFTDADTEKSPAAILISEAMAKQFWPGESALGKRLEMTFAPGVKREVVGIVADVKLRGLARRDPIAALYVPMNQMPRPWTYLLVRTAPDPRSLARPLQAAVRAVDPEQPVVQIQTMEEHMRESLAHARFNMMLLAVFAGLALVLSAIGIYSVLAYSVRRRTREIGIRMALGATARDVLRHVVVQGMRPALLGLAIGLGGALALGRTLSSLVFGIPATDLTTFASVAALLGFVALAACAVPAWRATRVQPTVALAEG